MKNSHKDNIREYSKVLEILLEISTSMKKYNNLLRIWNATEDNGLKNLISSTSQFIEMRAKDKSKLPGIHLIREDDPKFSPIIDYCHSCIKSKKPQWQIIAEKNGWHR